MYLETLWVSRQRNFQISKISHATEQTSGLRNRGILWNFFGISGVSQDAEIIVILLATRPTFLFHSIFGDFPLVSVSHLISIQRKLPGHTSNAYFSSVLWPATSSTFQR